MISVLPPEILAEILNYSSDYFHDILSRLMLVSEHLKKVTMKSLEYVRILDTSNPRMISLIPNLVRLKLKVSRINIHSESNSRLESRMSLGSNSRPNERSLSTNSRLESRMSLGSIKFINPDKLKYLEISSNHITDLNLYLLENTLSLDKLIITPAVEYRNDKFTGWIRSRAGPIFSRIHESLTARHLTIDGSLVRINESRVESLSIMNMGRLMNLILNHYPRLTRMEISNTRCHTFPEHEHLVSLILINTSTISIPNIKSLRHLEVSGSLSSILCQNLDSLVLSRCDLFSTSSIPQDKIRCLTLVDCYNIVLPGKIHSLAISGGSLRFDEDSLTNKKEQILDNLNTEGMNSRQILLRHNLLDNLNTKHDTSNIHHSLILSDEQMLQDSLDSINSSSQQSSRINNQGTNNINMSVCSEVVNLIIDGCLVKYVLIKYVSAIMSGMMIPNLVVMSEECLVLDGCSVVNILDNHQNEMECVSMNLSNVQNEMECVSMKNSLCLRSILSKFPQDWYDNVRISSHIKQYSKKSLTSSRTPGLFITKD